MAVRSVLEQLCCSSIRVDFELCDMDLLILGLKLFQTPFCRIVEHSALDQLANLVFFA